MAKRLYFVATPGKQGVFTEECAEFTYYTGFAVSQKQKSISSMHESIKRTHPDLRVLEISTKSTEPLGVTFSAFNLRLADKEGATYPLECIFQSSKVFEHGGPYTDLLHAAPRDAKRDERLRSSGKLQAFKWEGFMWALEPKTWFYDWLYVNAVAQDEKSAQLLLDYDAFTDIEFNHQKSINCQARAAAIYVSLCRMGKLDLALRHPDAFKELCYLPTEELQQLGIQGLMY